MDAQKINLLRERINRCPFNRLNGIRAVEVGDGSARIAATLTRDSMNIWGIPHGGLLFALGDVAAGLAAQSVHDGSVVSVNGSISFLAAAKNSDCLSAQARVTKKGKTVAFIRAEISADDGTKLAEAQFVMHLS